LERVDDSVHIVSGINNRNLPLCARARLGLRGTVLLLRTDVTEPSMSDPSSRHRPELPHPVHFPDQQGRDTT
jgi:hypothetical protein